MGSSGSSFKKPNVQGVFLIGRITFTFIAACLIMISGNAYAQSGTDSLTARAPQEDSIALTPSKAKDPKVATLLAALLPGAGQAYNEKIWKVPIIYGGIISTAYFVEFNNRRYQKFKEALAIVRDPDLGPNPFPSLNQDGIIRNVDYWRRNRDLCYLIFGVIYVLNIVDAQVDAHLSSFDVSDDLSWKLEPSFETLTAGRNSIGLSLKLNF